MEKKKILGPSQTSIISKTSTGVTYRRIIAKPRTGPEIDEFKKEYTTDAHSITLPELEAKYTTNIIRGLVQIEAEERLKKYGANSLIETSKVSRWWTLFNFLFCGFAALLWVGAILTFTGYAISYYSGYSTSDDQLYLGSILIIINLFTGLFGFYQQSANVAIMSSFKKMTPKFASAIRDGEKIMIPTEEVVIGDVIEIKAGNFVPADIRLIEASSLKVDNSPITGESFPQNRTATCTDPNPLETSNLVFYGTNVIEGSGKGIAINCGENTLIGHIAGLATSLEKEETLIHKEVNNFIKIITILAFVIGIVFLITCLALGYDFFQSFTFFIAIIVANVPEGLPVTLTACMTLTAKRMASKNCMVKNLGAIETLGACNVICSDKTGTLTQNRMTASHLYYDNQMHYILTDLEPIDRESEAFLALCQIGILCNKATFVIGQKNIPIEHRETVGDASESAILKLMELLTRNVAQIRKNYPKVCEIPFSSLNKYQVSVNWLPTEGRYIVLMKGAPERIIERCTTIIREDVHMDFTPEIKKIVQKVINNLGLRGERVLAFADYLLPIEKFDKNYAFDADKLNFPINGLRFVGLISMVDPPRVTVPDAVEKCQDAGIRVIMVTGDHPVTAAAIARQVGIFSHTSTTSYDIALHKEISHSKVTEKDKKDCNAAVITGTDLKDMNESELQKNLIKYKEIVFARTSPQQKLKIVEALQHLDMIVAVTGDGVNDSPALKKADIGIAMGIAGSDVSKDAADMILLDDNFASIVTGIEEGRLIFDNLKKSIAYLLTSNVPEIVPFILMVTMNIPPPLSVMAIIVIDVGTDLWPAISLAYEKPEADIMKRKPRNPHKDKLINNRLMILTYAQIGVIQSCASLVSYFFIMARHGFFWDSLIGLRTDWEASHYNDLPDDYGQEWTFHEREILTYKCHSGFFLSIVITQVADLLICKTRRLSLFTQGMTNWVLNAGLFFEISLAGLVVYCPYLNTALQFAPVKFVSVSLAIPFAFIIFFYDEIRKYIIRKYPHGIVDKETYY